MKAFRKGITYLFIISIALLAALNYRIFIFPNRFAPSGINGIIKNPGTESNNRFLLKSLCILSFLHCITFMILPLFMSINQCSLGIFYLHLIGTR